VQPWNAHGKHHAIAQLDFIFSIWWLIFKLTAISLKMIRLFSGMMIDRSLGRFDLARGPSHTF